MLEILEKNFNLLVLMVEDKAPRTLGLVENDSLDERLEYNSSSVQMCLIPFPSFSFSIYHNEG